MSTLHIRVARLAQEHPELRHHLVPLLRKHALDRNAGFLDFLKRKPAKVKNKSGILSSILLPGQPSGPLALALNAVRGIRLHSVTILDWEAKDNGDTLVVDFDVLFERPDRPDPDDLPRNYESDYRRALQPLAKEISALLNTTTLATVEYDMDRGIIEGKDPQISTPYQAIFKLPRGTSQEQMTQALNPSPARVASRYARRR